MSLKFKKTLISNMINSYKNLSLIVLVCMASSGVIVFAKADVINVPGERPTIQAALNASEEGDTVLVAEGEYREELSLKDGVVLQGAGEKSVLCSSVKVLNVTDAVINDFAMKGGTDDDHFGIFCRNAKVTIKNMTIWGFHHAISAESSQVSLKNNVIINSFNVGILVSANSKALIEGNQVSENQGTGMIISSSDREIVVSNNTIEKNYTAGIDCHYASPIIRQNLITQNSFGILIDNAQPDLGTIDEPGLNVIYDNKEGDLINSGDERVYAQQNYWGNPDGPCDDCVVGKVEYDPWLQQESPPDFPVDLKTKLSTVWGEIKKSR